MWVGDDLIALDTVTSLVGWFVECSPLITPTLIENACMLVPPPPDCKVYRVSGHYKMIRLYQQVRPVCTNEMTSCLTHRMTVYLT